jgi:branched-chain amino acid transport system substrate-binding protein
MQYAITGGVMVLILAGVVFFALQNEDPADDVIRIGATVSETGKYSVEGNRVKNGYELAVDQINAAGGVSVGGDKFKIELITYDDTSDAGVAGTLYDKLIDEDQVHILMGPYSSGIVLGVAPYAEAAKIPFVQAGGASDSIFSQGYDYVFGLYRVGSTYTQPFFQWLNTSGNIAEIDTITIFHEGDSFSTSVYNGALNFIQNAGITISNDFGYSSGDLDSIGTSMSTVQNSEADVILTIGHYADVKKVVDEISVNNLSPKAVYGTVGIPEPKFVDEVGDAANNTMGFAQWVTNIPESAAPGITQFISDYEAEYDETPAYHATGGFAAVQVVAAAITEAGTFTDGDAVRAALDSIDVDTVWGNVQFEDNGVIAGPAYMVQIQNDDIETVYPDDYATGEIVFPRT